MEFGHASVALFKSHSPSAVLQNQFPKGARFCACARSRCRNTKRCASLPVYIFATRILACVRALSRTNSVSARASGRIGSSLLLGTVQANKDRGLLPWPRGSSETQPKQYACDLPNSAIATNIFQSQARDTAKAKAVGRARRDETRRDEKKREPPNCVVRAGTVTTEDIHT